MQKGKKMSKLKDLLKLITKKSGSLSEEEQKRYDEVKADGKMESATKDVAESIGGASHKTLYKIFLSVLLISSIVIFVSSYLRYTELKSREEVLKNEVKQIELEIDELQYRIGVPENDYDYMVRVAKEKLGLYFPDETIYYNGMNK